MKDGCSGCLIPCRYACVGWSLDTKTKVCVIWTQQCRIWAHASGDVASASFNLEWGRHPETPACWYLSSMSARCSRANDGRQQQPTSFLTPTRESKFASLVNRAVSIGFFPKTAKFNQTYIKLCKLPAKDIEEWEHHVGSADGDRLGMWNWIRHLSAIPVVSTSLDVRQLIDIRAKTSENSEPKGNPPLQQAHDGF